MPTSSRLATVSRFPLTNALYKHVFKGSKSKNRSHIVSEQLCSESQCTSRSIRQKTSELTCQCFCTADILQRLSPYLRRNSPLDILDLWPGAGLWSSKVNDFLQPRRHVLVEPDLRAYARFLEPFVNSKPCYELTSMDEYSTNDWTDVFARCLPEQGPPSGQENEALPKNDTLLVLATPPSQRNVRDHFTPARWWGGVMESCMQQKGLHMYGSVRILASVPPTDAEDILPRTAIERRRPGIMTENVALHAWEVANAYNHEQWNNRKQLQLTENIKKRVAERAAAQNIITPIGREPPPVILAPQSPRQRNNTRPYVPRASTDWHEGLSLAIQLGDEVGEEKTAAAKEARKKRTMAIQALNQDNANAHVRQNITKTQMGIDERTQNLSRAAADPQRTVQELAVLDKSLAESKTNFAHTVSNEHYRSIRGYDREIDDWRIANRSNHFDDSTLLWERRPFEPLCIDPEEHYPRESRTMIYFEADANSPVMKKLKELPEEKREEMMKLFDAMSLMFSTRGNMSVEEMVHALFSGRSANEIVKAIPSLATFAGKQLKPGCGVVPLDDPTLDPHECFQENIDYDLSDVRIRCLPITTMWEILLEYHKHSMDLSPAHFSRLLGSTLTSSRAGGPSPEALKLR